MVAGIPTGLRHGPGRLDSGSFCWLCWGSFSSSEPSPWRGRGGGSPEMPSDAEIRLAVDVL